MKDNKEDNVVLTLAPELSENHDLILDTDKFYVDENDTIIVNLNEDINFKRIVDEINKLITKTEEELVENYLERIEFLLKKLPFTEERTEFTYILERLKSDTKAPIFPQKLECVTTEEIKKTVNYSNDVTAIDIALVNIENISYMDLGKVKRNKVAEKFLKNKNKKYDSLEQIDEDLELIIKDIKEIKDTLNDTITLN